MPRIPTIDPADSDGSNREVFQQFLNERGNIPNMMRTAGHRPELLRTMVAHMRAVMRGGTVAPLLKELIAVRVSQINHCDYCIASHTGLARKLGAKAEQFDGMRDLARIGSNEPTSFPADCLGTAPIEPPPRTDESSEEMFTPAEKAALTFAEEMTKGSGHLSEETYAALVDHFEPAEIVEITAVIGLFNYFNRFTNALEIEVTR